MRVQKAWNFKRFNCTFLGYHNQGEKQTISQADCETDTKGKFVWMRQ